MAILNKDVKRTVPDGDATLSNRIYSDEFKKIIQAQKRFSEVWKGHDVSWNHELFQYANEDFYFYRFHINRLERNTTTLLRNIILRLLNQYKDKIKWEKGSEPVLFKVREPIGSAVGYTLKDLQDCDEIAAICRRNRVNKVYIIRTWKTAYAKERVERENARYKSNGTALRAVSIGDFFTSMFGKEEYQRFESHLLRFLDEVYNIVGYRSIKFLSSMNLAAQKLVLEKKLLEYAGKRMCYTVVDRTKPEVQKYLYVDGYSFPAEIEGAIQSNFTKNGLYKVLLGSAEFAESFVTSEWLFHSLEGTEHYDYTSIISGYLKSVEQLLLKIILANVGNNCKITLDSNKREEAKQAGVPRYYICKNTRKFKPLYGDNTRKWEYIDLEETHKQYMKSDLGTFEHFLKNNPHVFFSQLQPKPDIDKENYCDIIADIVCCFRAECRNGYFHTHNLNVWDTVVNVRENALMIYTLLLGGCNLPAAKIDELKLSDYDWFDELCIKLQDNRRNTLDYVFEYSDGRKVCVVFDTYNNTKEYTDSGIEHYESLEFYCVPDFSLESYEKLDDGVFDSSKTTLTRESVPHKIYAIDRNKQKTLIYEATN